MGMISSRETDCKDRKLRRATATRLCWPQCDQKMAFGKENGRVPAVTTHIIIGAVVAENGDAPTAKLQDENGQGIECHGWERAESLPFALGDALIY